MTEANAALDQIAAIVAAKDGVQRRLAEMTGAGSFTQRTNLVFADPRFERIVATLRAMAGTLEPLELAENGLGYNNLLYTPCCSPRSRTPARPRCDCCSSRSRKRTCTRSSKTS